MKRTMALLLALIMLFALCACGKSEESTPEESKSEESKSESEESEEKLLNASEIFKNENFLDFDKSIRDICQSGDIIFALCGQESDYTVFGASQSGDILWRTDFYALLAAKKLMPLADGSVALVCETVDAEGYRVDGRTVKIDGTGKLSLCDVSPTGGFSDGVLAGAIDGNYILLLDNFINSYEYKIIISAADGSCTEGDGNAKIGPQTVFGSWSYEGVCLTDAEGERTVISSSRCRHEDGMHNRPAFYRLNSFGAVTDSLVMDVDMCPLMRIKDINGSIWFANRDFDADDQDTEPVSRLYRMSYELDILDVYDFGGDFIMDGVSCGDSAAFLVKRNGEGNGADIVIIDENGESRIVEQGIIGPKLLEYEGGFAVFGRDPSSVYTDNINLAESADCRIDYYDESGAMTDSKVFQTSKTETGGWDVDAVSINGKIYFSPCNKVARDRLMPTTAIIEEHKEEKRKSETMPTVTDGMDTTSKDAPRHGSANTEKVSGRYIPGGRLYTYRTTGLGHAHYIEKTDNQGNSLWVAKMGENLDKWPYANVDKDCCIFNCELSEGNYRDMVLDLETGKIRLIIDYQCDQRLIPYRLKDGYAYIYKGSITFIGDDKTVTRKNFSDKLRPVEDDENRHVYYARSSANGIILLAQYIPADSHGYDTDEYENILFEVNKNGQITKTENMPGGYFDVRSVMTGYALLRFNIPTYSDSDRYRVFLCDEDMSLIELDKDFARMDNIVEWDDGYAALGSTVDGSGRAAVYYIGKDYRILKKTVMPSQGLDASPITLLKNGGIALMLGTSKTVYFLDKDLNIVDSITCKYGDIEIAENGTVYRNGIPVN